MSASRVLAQIVKLIKEGRVSEETASDILQASRVELVTNKGQVGTYTEGMLRVGEGIVSLDPMSVTSVRMPTEWKEFKAEQDLERREEIDRRKKETEDKAEAEKQAEVEKEAEDKAEAEKQAAAKAADKSKPEGRTIDGSASNSIPFESEGGAA